MNMLEARGVTKNYRLGNRKITVLDEVSPSHRVNSWW